MGTVEDMETLVAAAWTEQSVEAEPGGFRGLRDRWGCLVGRNGALLPRLPAAWLYRDWDAELHGANKRAGYK